MPVFSRLDVLFGERQIIMPTYQDQPHDIFEAPTQSFVLLLEKASSSQASDSTDSDLIQPLNDVNSSSSDLSSPSVKFDNVYPESAKKNCCGEKCSSGCFITSE